MRITGIEPFTVSTYHHNAKRHWLIFKLRSWRAASTR